MSVRNQRWRWGSCSRGGHVCLNWRLVIVPPDVRDYVIVHVGYALSRLDEEEALKTLALFAELGA